MSEDSAAGADAGLAASATVELVLNVTVLLLILVPTLAVVFPALFLLIGATLLASMAPDSGMAQWIAGDRYSPLAVACALAFIVGGTAILFDRLGASQGRLNLRPLSGADGAKLGSFVQDIWIRVAGRARPIAIRWFPAMDIAAYAAMPRGSAELQVSAGLWRAANSGEPIARAIIAHEIAHLRYRDPQLLNVVRSVIAATRAIMVVTGALAAVIVGFVFYQRTSSLIAQGVGASQILSGWVTIAAAAAVVVILLPLGWFALRRQAAFVTALVEIRADIAGAVWTEGLRHFTQAFASHEGVVPSKAGDLISALFSPRLTHIPERQRLAILNAPSLIISPKIQFLAFSLTLVFLLPINFATPLFWGGVGNHLAIQSLACIFNAALVSMPILGQSDGRILLSTRRLVTLAIVSVVVSGPPRINLEPISYLAMSWLAGFGGQGTDWASLPGDIAVTLQDLFGKARTALFNLSALVAILVSFLGLLLLAHASSQASLISRPLRAAIAATLAATFSLAGGYDPYRALPLDFLEGVASFLEENAINPSLLLCLPIAGAALVDAFFALMSRRTRARAIVTTPGPEGAAGQCASYDDVASFSRDRQS